MSNIIELEQTIESLKVVNDAQTDALKKLNNELVRLKQSRGKLLNALDYILDGLSTEAWDSLNPHIQGVVMCIYDAERSGK